MTPFRLVVTRVVTNWVEITCLISLATDQREELIPFLWNDAPGNCSTLPTISVGLEMPQIVDNI